MRILHYRKSRYFSYLAVSFVLALALFVIWKLGLVDLGIQKAREGIDLLAALPGLILRRTWEGVWHLYISTRPWFFAGLMSLFLLVAVLVQRTPWPQFSSLFLALGLACLFLLPLDYFGALVGVLPFPVKTRLVFPVFFR